MTASRHPSVIPYGQYRRALAYVVPYWRGLLVVMLLGLFSTAVGLAQPYISRLLIDDALLRRNLHALTYIAAAMVVVTIVGFALNIASSYCYVRLSSACLFDMRLAVYRHLQRLSPRYFPTRSWATSYRGSTTTSVRSSASAPTPCCRFSRTFSFSWAALPSCRGSIGA